MPKIYSAEESTRNILYARSLFYELYEEYALSFEPESEGLGGIFRAERTGSVRKNSSSNNYTSVGNKPTGTKRYSGWHDFAAYVSENTSKRPTKSNLDKYLEDVLEICPNSGNFDVISWWKNTQMKYRILSRMVVDILHISISTVASESTFSASDRVVDTYRSKLGVETVQAYVDPIGFVVTMD